MQQQNKVLNDVVQKLSEESSFENFFYASKEGTTLPSAKVLKEIVSICRAILFPGYYGNTCISKQTLCYHTGVNTSKLYNLLIDQIYAGLCFQGDLSSCNAERLKTTAESIAIQFMTTLPQIRNSLCKDIQAVYDNDPAIKDIKEVIFSYPSFRAISVYRIAHELYKLKVPYIPRMLAELAHFESGIDIHPGAEIGSPFTIFHGTGIVIGETSIIGRFVRIFQGVSLVCERLQPTDQNKQKKIERGLARHPIIGDNVTIYANATLMGRIKIGKNVTICGNVWVSEDVPEGLVVKQSNTIS